METRRKIKGNETTDEEELRKINKEVSKAIRKDLRKFKNEKVQRTIEENKSLQVLRRRLNNGKCEIHKLKNKEGVPTSNREELLHIVEDFYQELYTSQREDQKNLEAAASCKMINQGSELMPEITL
uniref:Uncharacterized protein LOC114347914 n=1 Tax=Diabrotica virgifera virgifera TaxID=50390 RepID=A0A6P7GXA6_DIAVI